MYDPEEERMETEELWDMEEEEKQLIEEKEERLTQGFGNDSYNPQNPYHASTSFCFFHHIYSIPPSK